MMNDKTHIQPAGSESVLTSGFWESCTYFAYSPPGPIDWRPLERGLSKIVLLRGSYLKFDFSPNPHAWEMIAPEVSWRLESYYLFLFDLKQHHREGYIYNFTISSSSHNTSPKLDVLSAPDDLRGNATFEVENVDQGDHDILLTYSQYYKVKINLRDDWAEFMGSVKSITFPENAKYFVEVMTGAKSLANEGGTNHADSFQDGTYLFRMRYKNVDDVYYGPVELVLNYENGVKHTLPVEVIKKEVLEAAPGFKL